MEECTLTSRAHTCSDRSTRTVADSLSNGSCTVCTGCLSDSPLFPSWRKCVILGIQNSESQRSGAPAMTFDEILAQIIDLLKRQGRVSYSALKRRFALDDDYLNDLKDELLYVHESEVEADDRGFTWTGGTEDRQATPSQSDQTAPQSVVEHAPPAQEISVPA